MKPSTSFAFCGLVALWCAGWVALATRRLNLDSPWSILDSLFLLLNLALLYAAVFAIYGLALLALTWLLERPWLTARRGWLPSPASLRLFAMVFPWTATWLLPEWPPLGRWLQHATLPLSPGSPIVLALVTLATTLFLLWLGGRLAQQWPFLRRRGWLLACLVLCAPSLWFWIPLPEAEADVLLLDPLPEALGDPPPLVLLVIDGADLDDMILPMVASGELPAFASLMQEGTWGFLGSREPTLSPVLWTTLATGQPMETHGIRDFVFYHLPYVTHPIHRFPAASGLNHKFFPLLEKLNVGYERPPYNRLQRRSRALWSIVGERYPVGVYRWLVTWPAAPVNGFLVAGGVYAGPGDWNPRAKTWLRRMRRNEDQPMASLSIAPADAMDGLNPHRVNPPADAVLQAYAPDLPLDKRQRNFRLIARSFADATQFELPQLISKYSPRFVAASFYAVDAFQHRFGGELRDGGPWAGAIAQRYRETDRQLGRFLADIDETTHVLVISDHGYDFELDHHWQAPAGVFLGRGPAFEASRRYDGLSLVDIAPLVLHLLEFPLPEDLPGVQSGTFRQVLGPHWPKEAETLATYERPRTATAEALLPATLSQEMKDELRSLGYLE